MWGWGHIGAGYGTEMEQNEKEVTAFTVTPFNFWLFLVGMKGFEPSTP